jgi:hypothetical protein
VNWFRAKQISAVEFVALGNDPVLNDGVAVWLAKQPDSTLPVVVSFVTNKVIVGFKPEEFQKHVDVLLERNSPSSFTVAESESVNPEPAPAVASEEAPPQRVQ